MITSDCPCPNPRILHLHGTRTRYRQCKCRCDQCVSFFRSEDKRLRHNRNQGQRIKRSAVQVRAKINELLSRGITISQISNRTGVSIDSLADIRNGVNKRCYPVTWDAVMGSSWSMVSAKDKPKSYVNSYGTRRRIQALMALGWDTGKIAAEAGLAREQVRSQLRADRNRVKTSTALAIIKAYDGLWYRTPSPRGPEEEYSASRAKGLARRNGWVSPLAWDEDIDDPKARPHGHAGNGS